MLHVDAAARMDNVIYTLRASTRMLAFSSIHNIIVLYHLRDTQRSATAKRATALAYMIESFFRKGGGSVFWHVMYMLCMCESASL